MTSKEYPHVFDQSLSYDLVWDCESHNVILIECDY